MYMQISAAINPGNSGGPAFASLEDGQVAGVAFGKRAGMEGTGFIIPHTVVKHFLHSYDRFGSFQGVCCLGFRYQRMENQSLRAHYKVCASLAHHCLHLLQLMMYARGSDVRIY